MDLPNNADDIHPQPHKQNHTLGDERCEAERATRMLWQKDPSQLSTTIAYKFSFRPSPNSLAVIGLREHEVILMVLAKIPAAADLSRPDHISSAWEAFAPSLHNREADAVVIIAYTGAERTADIHRFADAAPVPVNDPIRVHKGRYWFLDCHHHPNCTSTGCLPEGAELAENPDLVATLILDGTGIAGTYEDLVRSLQPGPPALIDSVATVLASNPIPDQKILNASVAQAHDERIDGPLPLHPWHAALLLQALANPDLWNACVPWCDDAAWWLWHDLIPAAPPGWIGPVATLIATTAYQRGNGAMTTIAAEVALADQPGYAMAHHVLDCSESAMPPHTFREAIVVWSWSLDTKKKHEPRPQV